MSRSVTFKRSNRLGYLDTLGRLHKHSHYVKTEDLLRSNDELAVS